MTERLLRGIPLWLLRDYLVEVGGYPGEGEVIIGEGWRAGLSQVEDFVVGSLRVGQVKLVIEGETDVVARVWGALEPKLLRGGG